MLKLPRVLISLVVCLLAPSAFAGYGEMIGSPYVSPGGTIRYEIYATAQVPATITLHLPPGTTFSSQSGYGGCHWTTSSISGGDVVCDVTFRENFDYEIDYAIFASVAPSVPAGSSLAASATLDFGSTDVVKLAVTTAVVPPTDLAATVTAASPAKAGRAYPLTVRLTNLGASTAHQPGVTLSRPPGGVLRFTGPGATTWQCSSRISTTWIDCLAPDLEPGMSSEATIQAYSDPGATSDTVHVETWMLNLDSNRSNSVFDVVTPLTTIITPSATNSAMATARVGYDYNVSLNLGSDGPSAHDVTISYDTPPNTVFRSVSAPPGMTCTTPSVDSPGTVVCSAPLLAGTSLVAGQMYMTGGLWSLTVGVRTTVPGQVTHSFTANASNFAAPLKSSAVVAVAVNVIDLSPTFFEYNTSRGGEDGSFFLRLENRSAWIAENITLDFALPAGAVFKPPAGVACTGTSCTIASLRIAEFRTDEFKIQLPRTPGPAVFAVTIGGPAIIPVTLSQTLNITIPDIQVSASLLPSQTRVLTGGDVDFALHVKNAGHDATSAITASLAVPPSLQIYTAGSSLFTRCSAPPQVQCEASALPANWEEVVHFRAHAGTPGVAPVTATVTTPGVTVAPATATITIADPVSILSSTLTSDRTVVPTGDRVVYTLRVANAGPDDAHTLIGDVSVQGDSGTASVNASGFANCTVQRPLIHCEAPLLTAGSAATAAITLLAPQSTATISATATVTSTGNAPQTANVSTPVVSRGLSDVAVLTPELTRSAAIGQPFVVHFTVTNIGATDAASVAFDATLSAGLALGSLTASRGSCIATRCTIGTLTAGASADLTLTAVATRPAGGVVRGAATTSSQQASPDNDTQQVTVNVAAPRTRAVRH